MKLGITGNFASGKGTVCSFFQELGAIVIDTDIIARDIVSPGSDCLKKIIHAFGDSFVDSSGNLRRRELAIEAFSSNEKTAILNEILHPAIKSKVEELTSDSGKIYVINTPLLFESGFDDIMDVIITVSSDQESLISRGMHRDKISAEEIKKRLSHQFSLKEKEKRSDYVIDNSGDLENTKKQVVAIWNRIFSRNPK
jgi:dephospho-CoA kinase